MRSSVPNNVWKVCGQRIMTTIFENCMKMKNIGEWRGFGTSPLPHESVNNLFEIHVNRVYLCLGVAFWHLCDGSEARHVTDEQCNIHNSAHVPGQLHNSWPFLAALLDPYKMTKPMHVCFTKTRSNWSNVGELSFDVYRFSFLIPK